MQRVFHAQQFVGFLLFEFEQRNARHLGDYVGDIFLRNHGLALFLILLPLELGIL